MPRATRGLVHRASAKNVLCGGVLEEEQAVADFRIVKDLNATTFTTTGWLVGTPDFMAPEQVEGGRSAHQTDIYALGVILFLLLTDRLPFARGDEDPATMLARVREDPPPPRPWLPGLLRTPSCAPWRESRRAVRISG